MHAVKRVRHTVHAHLMQLTVPRTVSLHQFHKSRILCPPLPCVQRVERAVNRKDVSALHIPRSQVVVSVHPSLHRLSLSGYYPRPILCGYRRRDSVIKSPVIMPSLPVNKNHHRNVTPPCAESRGHGLADPVMIHRVPRVRLVLVDQYNYHSSLPCRLSAEADFLLFLLSP